MQLVTKSLLKCCSGDDKTRTLGHRTFLGAPNASFYFCLLFTWRSKNHWNLTYIADFEELLSFFPLHGNSRASFVWKNFSKNKKRLHLCWFQIRSYLVEDQSLLSHPSHKHDVSIYGPCKQATWSYMPSCWHYKFFSDYVIEPSVLPCPLNEPPCC